MSSENFKLYDRVISKDNPSTVGTIVFVAGYDEYLVQMDICLNFRHRLLNGRQMMRADRWDEVRGAFRL